MSNTFPGIVGIVLTAAALSCVSVAQQPAAKSENTKALIESSEGVLKIRVPADVPIVVLARYENRAARQLAQLTSFSDSTLICAELPGTAQKGRFELRRFYTFQSGMEFKPEKFTGDRFVKVNVIARLLQAEAEHFSNGKEAETAIALRNYKFKYKDAEQIDGRPVYVFQVKPRISGQVCSKARSTSTSIREACVVPRATLSNHLHSL